MTEDPWPPEDAARLARARVPMTPPADGEARLVAALRERGLVRAARRAAALAWIAAVAALLIVLALAFCGAG